MKHGMHFIKIDSTSIIHPECFKLDKKNDKMVLQYYIFDASQTQSADY